MQVADYIFLLSLLILYFLPRKSEKVKYIWILSLIVFLLNFGIRIYLINERNNKSETITQMDTKIKDQESNIKSLKEKNIKQEQDMKDRLAYGDIAQFNWHGMRTVDPRGGGFSTPYSDWEKSETSDHRYMRLVRKKTVLNKVGFEWDCDATAKEHYKTKINKYPRFPFPYVALASCQKTHDNPSWKNYWIEAINILSKTAKVAGPHVTVHKYFLEQAEYIPLLPVNKETNIIKDEPRIN